MAKANLERYNNKQSNTYQNTLFSNTKSDDNITSKYINDGKINIKGHEWSNLNAKYTPNEIIDSIIENVKNGVFTFPYKDISTMDAYNSFKNLCQYKPNPLCSDSSCYSRFNDYEYNISDKYIREPVKFHDASNYFQQRNRMLATGAGRTKNVVEIFNSEKDFKNTLRALWSLKMSECTNANILTCMQMRDYIASQFNPTIAKSLYTLFNSENVLDFSSGWGDRLCGAYATPSVKSYIGIDPNSLVYEKYYEQAEFYSKIAGKKHTEFYNLPAEEVDIESDIVDTIFTSPPYFNAEKYTSDNTQSYVRYTNADAWLEGFMYPTLEMCSKALKYNGFLIINISDIYDAKTGNRVEFCNKMNQYIKNLGFNYIGEIGMYMSKRPNVATIEKMSGVFVEPMWVWQKSKNSISNGFDLNSKIQHSSIKRLF